METMRSAMSSAGSRATLRQASMILRKRDLLPEAGVSISFLSRPRPPCPMRLTRQPPGRTHPSSELPTPHASVPTVHMGTVRTAVCLRHASKSNSARTCKGYQASAPEAGFKTMRLGRCADGVVEMLCKAWDNGPGLGMTTIGPLVSLNFSFEMYCSKPHRACSPRIGSGSSIAMPTAHCRRSTALSSCNCRMTASISSTCRRSGA
mmetsp:Transcript_56824/g.151673  ORF Transcript_56824/g.151673 Transcript_56824/m.151673 type:complete len:206 (-) Transcript_56824:1852-2469(-)